MKNQPVIRAVAAASVAMLAFVASPACAQSPLKLTLTDTNNDGSPDRGTLSMPGCSYLGGGLGDNCSTSNFGYFNCPMGSDTCDISSYLSGIPSGFRGELKVWTWCAIPNYVYDCKSVSIPAPDFIAPIDSTPGGRTYGQWAAAYWQWVLGVPDNKFPQQSGNQRVNPLNDKTGAYCGEHQIGDVWFLAGSLVGAVSRSCTIPAGKSIFFPFITNGYFGFLTDPASQRSDKYAHDNAACTKPVTISASLDGNEIKNPLGYSTSRTGSSPSPAFNVQMPPGIAGGGPGNLFESLGYKSKQIPEWFLSPSAEDGYYLFLRPLPPGTHTIAWTASGCTEGWSQAVTYNLTVQAPTAAMQTTKGRQ